MKNPEGGCSILNQHYSLLWTKIEGYQTLFSIAWSFLLGIEDVSFVHSLTMGAKTLGRQEEQSLE